jgi:hypothetical protein
MKNYQLIKEDLIDVVYLAGSIVENSWSTKEDKEELNRFVKELNELISKEDVLPIEILDLIDPDLFAYENKKLVYVGNLSLRMTGKPIRLF